MEIEQPKSLALFCLYHKDDVPFYNGLKNHLMGLLCNGLLNDKSQIDMGSIRIEAIKNAVAAADIIILLISGNFNGSSEFNALEIRESLQKRAEKGACVWPIIARHFYWVPKSSMFAPDYELFMGNDKAIQDGYASTEEAYKKITEKIYNEILYLRAESWIQQGNTYRQQQDLEKALTCYQEACGCIKDYPYGLLEIGRTFQLQKKGEEAKQHFQRVISTYAASLLEKKRNSMLPCDHMDLLHTNAKGFAHTELGDFATASESFQAVLQQITIIRSHIQRKIRAEAHCGQGDTFLRYNRKEEPAKKEFFLLRAAKAYHEAMRIFPENLHYHTKAGDTYIQLGMHTEALETYEQAISQHPTSVQMHVGKGNALAGLGQFDAALDAYEDVLGFDPTHMLAQNGKAAMLKLLGRLEEAREAYLAALRLNSQSASNYYGYGFVLAQQGNHQQAVEAYEQAKKLGANDNSFFIDYAASLLILGDEKTFAGRQIEARAYYIKIPELYAQVHSTEQNQFTIYIGTAKAYAATNNWNQAIRCYEWAIRLAPEHAEGYLELGKTYIKIRNYQGAEKALRRAFLCLHQTESSLELQAKVESAYGDFYHNMAMYPSRKQDYTFLKRARWCYQEAIRIHPHLQAYLGLGRTYLLLFDYERAIGAFQKALASQYDIVECYFLIGKCYYAQQKYQLAISSYEQAIRYGADNAQIYLALGEAHLYLKQYLQAEKAFGTAVCNKKTRELHAYCGYATALYSQGRLDETISFLEDKVKSNERLSSQKRYKQLLESMSSFIDRRLDKNPTDIFFNRCKGDTMLLLGDRLQEAINAYNNVIDYGYRAAEIYYRRGKAKEELAKYEEAYKDYMQAWNTDSSHLEARRGLKRVEGFLHSSGIWIAKSRPVI